MSGAGADWSWKKRVQRSFAAKHSWVESKAGWTAKMGGQQSWVDSKAGWAVAGLNRPMRFRKDVPDHAAIFLVLLAGDVRVHGQGGRLSRECVQGICVLRNAADVVLGADLQGGGSGVPLGHFE